MIPCAIPERPLLHLSDGIPEVPTERLVGLNGRRLKILPGRKSFPRPESLGQPFIPHPWDGQGGGAK
jgi:hypothetical protein